MAARLDLEARLRALRAPEATSSSHALTLPTPPSSPPSRPVPSSSSPAAAVDDDMRKWPEVPHAWPDVPHAAPTKRGFRSSLCEPLEVTVIPRRASSVSSNPHQQQQEVQMPRMTSAAAEEEETTPLVSVSSLLGPAYDEAVQIAQYAIDNERNSHVHTAIDAYIRAGQMLISIGRQQHTAHLQNIVKKKALALLERAEGLSDWVNSIGAAGNNKAEIDAAFAESQRENEQSLTEKEALVAQMKSENTKMSEKLNQLVLLTKVRARFRRVLSERRARKAEEALRKASLHDKKGDENPETAPEEEEEHDVDELRSSRSSSASSSSFSSSSSGFTKPSPQQREEQKRDLINELHTRIGLPEINQLRKFTPLNTDAKKDIRHVELEDELEAARLEAERLRAAVQEMEECFQATLEQTRQQSLKLRQEKDENLAKMEDELERVRSELERERRLTATSFGSSRSNHLNHDDGDDDDPDSYEDVAMIRTLRSSLHAMDAPASSSSSRSLTGNNNNDEEPEREHSSREFREGSSLKHTWYTSESEDDSDVDEDGGVWL